jgi:hypothetical protein
MKGDPWEDLWEKQLEDLRNLSGGQQRELLGDPKEDFL